jgi:plastocyanin
MKKLLLFLFCIPFLGIAQNSHTINTAGSTFSPSSLTVNVGDTVNWNNTGGSHNVNATQVTFPNNPEGFGNSVGAGWTFQWIFTMAGTYDYQCDPHAPGMSGVIIANALLPVFGCMDTLSDTDSYDPLATIDDGSCVYDGGGCMDSTACNYSPIAYLDIGNCTGLRGCMTPTACNYDSTATCDDGSCLTAYGCMDATACNYDNTATCDDGSCTGLVGCTYPVACGYDAAATCDDGSCLFPNGCTDLAACNYDASATCDDGSCTGILGCIDATACNYDSTATCDDASCILPNGCTDDSACNYDATATCDDGSCAGNSGCIDATACNYDSTATCDDGSCLTAYGCMDVTACNYDGSATCDDGTCNTVYGCMDPSACNYDLAATCDTGSWTCQGVSGCMDSTANNYDSTITCDNGSCTYLLPYANLFFSEYAEGSGNNKYFEVYNPTSDTVDLTNYAFARVSNNPGNGVGVYEYWINFDSSSIILPNDVYVVVHPSSDPFILAEADMDYGSLSNGDDGFALVYGNQPVSPISPDSGAYIILDWIGDWNGDPGQGWEVAGVSNATANHTLIRKCPISQGDTSWTNSAGNNAVNSQWIVLANNDWGDLGIHTYNTTVYDSLSFTICNGLSVTVGTNIYDSTGVYTDVLIATNGCDSIVVVNLTVLNTSASIVVNNITICDGDSVVIGNNGYNNTGTYTDTLVNSSGCDSVVTTNLTVQTPTYQDITICDGNSIMVGNSVYNTTGSYTDTIQSSIGCDSIVHTNLTIYSQFNSIFGGIADNTVGGGSFYSGQQNLEFSCYMPSELVSAVVYSADTTLTIFEIRDDNGNVLDDTTVNIIPGGHRIYFNYLMSAGSDYELGVNGGSNNLFRNNSGVSYPYNFGALAAVTSSSAGGQYYYFFYDIEVKQSSQPTNYSICDGESITVAGNVYNATGLYIDSLFSNLGCDSLVFTNLIVNPNIAFTNNQTICIGETYLLGGNIYDSTGIYIDSLNTQYGCDSIITTILVVNALTGGSSANQQTICFGDSVTVGSNIYFNAGIFLDTLISSNGCDSMVTTTLTTITANYASIFGGILDTSIGGGSFFSGSQYLELSCYESSSLASAVVYSKDTTLTTFEIRDDNGNVLDDTTVNIIPGGHRIYFNYEMLAGTDYELGVSGASDSLFRNNSGVNYPYNFASAVAITSSSAGGSFYYYYYDIEIIPLATYNAYSICEGDSIVVGPNVYDAAGDYTDYFVASNSCDSVVYTVLEVYQTPSLTIGSTPNPPEICIGETILLEGSPGFSYYWWDNGSTGSSLLDVPTEDTWYLLSAKDSNDCVVKEDILVFVDSCITGLDALSFEEGGLQIYPNPASEQLTIDFAGNATSIKVYNMLGELVVEKHITEGESSTQLFVKEWKGAMYSIQLYMKNGTITHKVFTVVR